MNDLLSFNADGEDDSGGANSDVADDGDDADGGEDSDTEGHA